MQVGIDHVAHIGRLVAQPDQLRIDHVPTGKTLRSERSAKSDTPIGIAAFRIGHRIIDARVPQNEPMPGVFDDGSRGRRIYLTFRKGHQ